MRTVTVESDREIAVMTQDLESLWIAVRNQPLVKPSALANLLAVFSPASANVVNGEELKSFFSTARTLSAVMLEKFNAAFSTPSFTSLQNESGMIEYPFSGTNLVATGILFRPRFPLLVITRPASYHEAIVTISGLGVFGDWLAQFTGIANSSSRTIARSVSRRSSRSFHGLSVTQTNQHRQETPRG